MRRIYLLAYLTATAVGLTSCTHGSNRPDEKAASLSSADSCDDGFPHRPITLPFVDAHNNALPIPSTVKEAQATFNDRAQAVLRWSACEDTKSDLEYTTKAGQDWLGSAMGHLAYEGLCPTDRDIDAKTATANRRKGIDERLGRIANACPVALLGSEIGGPDFSWLGIDVARTGELDFDLIDLLPIVLLYGPNDWFHDLANEPNGPYNHKHLLSDATYAHLVDFLKSDSGPNSEITLEVGLEAGPHAHIPESENHIWNIQSSKYLTNQILHGDSARYPTYAQDDTYDNRKNGMHDWIMDKLQGILRTDFHEYNSKAYTSYTVTAIQNLAEFAEDSDVRTAAQLVLNWSAAKFAISSSMMRRNSPYRRRGDHDSRWYTGLEPIDHPSTVGPPGPTTWNNTWNSDAYVCWFPLYSGQTQMYPDGDSLPSCGSLARRAIGSYRIHPLILDLAMKKDVPYFQTFSGGPNYLTSHAQGGVEIYDNEGPFLIAAGGIRTNNGLGVDLYTAFVWSGTVYSSSDSDVGTAVQTVLLQNGVPVNDRNALIRFDDPKGDHNLNALCVAPGFACGLNPTIPDDLCPDATDEYGLPIGKSCDRAGTSGWSFVDLQGGTDEVYVVMAGRGQAFGFFEAVARKKFASIAGGGDDSFGAFKAFVMAKNPQPFHASDIGLNVLFPHYVGTYTRVDGSTLDFAYDSAAPFWYPINSSAGNTPSLDTQAWNLADGPIQSDGHSAYITLTSPHYSGKCIIDMRDQTLPSWTCPRFDDIDGDGVPDEEDNCPTVPNRGEWPNQPQDNTNLEAEKVLGAPQRGDACDDNPTTAIGITGNAFSDGKRFGPCKEVLWSPGGGSVSVPNGKQCPMALSSVLTMDSFIGNATGDAPSAMGTTVLAACPCSDAEGLCAQAGCTQASDALLPSPDHEHLGGSQWVSMTQYTPATGPTGGTPPTCKGPDCLAPSLPYSGPYVPISTLFQEKTDVVPYTPATATSDWDFVQDLTRMGLPADATSVSVTLWGHVASFSPAPSEHGLAQDISNSYTSFVAKISDGIIFKEGPAPISVPWVPWDAVDPGSLVTFVGDPASPDPVLVVQHAGEAVASAASLGLAGPASSLLSGVMSGAADLLVSTDIRAGAAGVSRAPFAVTLSHGTSQIVGALTLRGRTLTGSAAAASPLLAAANLAGPASLRAYGAGAGKVFALTVGSDAATLDATDVLQALQGNPATTSARITGQVPASPMAMTWDGVNGRALVLDSAGVLCGAASMLRLLSITPAGESTTLWTTTPTIAATPGAAFLSMSPMGEIVVSLAGVPRTGRSEVAILDASGRPRWSGAYEGAFVGAAVADATGLSLPLTQPSSGGGSALGLLRGSRRALTAGIGGARWLSGSPDTVGLSHPGTEQCDTLSGVSFNPMLALLATAKGAVAADAQAHPGSDAQTACDSIDKATQTIVTGANWLSSNALDGTNPKAAGNVLSSMNDALPQVLAAAQYSAKSAASNGSADASKAFEALMSAASLMSELGTVGGRCDLDKQASWGDWRGGEVPASAATPPQPPRSCAALGPSALDPLSALLESSIAYERAELAANPKQGYDQYGQLDMAIDTAADRAVTNLRASLVASGLTAADGATAAAIQSALDYVADGVAVAGQKATYFQAWLPGTSRYAYEADRTATDYAITLAAEAGRCYQTRSVATCRAPAAGAGSSSSGP